MLRSLVGSEMCIRDRRRTFWEVVWLHSSSCPGRRQFPPVQGSVSARRSVADKLEHTQTSASQSSILQLVQTNLKNIKDIQGPLVQYNKGAMSPDVPAATMSHIQIGTAFEFCCCFFDMPLDQFTMTLFRSYNAFVCSLWARLAPMASRTTLTPELILSTPLECYP